MVIKFLSISLLICCFMGATAFAHTVTEGDSKKSGAIIHIAPDDDPIAGKVSTIFIDLTGGEVSTDTHYFSLTVRNTEGFDYPLPTQVDGSVVSGVYDFPIVGDYLIQLTATNLNTGEKTKFSLKQPVTRSVGVSDDNTVLKMAVLATGLLLLLSIYFAIVRREKGTTK